MEKLGSIPRTPTLRVLAAQQDLAFCFVYVKCWGTKQLMLCPPGASSENSAHGQDLQREADACWLAQERVQGLLLGRAEKGVPRTGVEPVTFSM